MAVRPGSVVVFSNKGKAFFSLMQRAVTRMWLENISPKKFGKGIMTHSAIMWYPEAQQDAIFEAQLCSTIDAFSNHTSNTKYWIFDPYAFNDQQIQAALYETYLKDSETSYGFLELPWFLYRFFMEIPFHTDVRHRRNWWPGGNICSQLVYNYLYSLSKDNKILRSRLDEYRSTTFHSSDTYTICSSLPEVFKLVAQQL